MNMIKAFCENTDKVYLNTKDITVLDTLHDKIDIKTTEIHRSRLYKNGNVLFNLSLGFMKTETIDTEIEYMKSIELFYPNKFSWIFDGRDIQMYAIIPLKEEYLGILGRYNTIYNFIRMLRDRIIQVLKYKGIDNVYITKLITDNVPSIGSINLDTDLYVVPITPKETKKEILVKSKTRVITNLDIKDLDMKFWVKEINPDFFKDRVYNETKKHIYDLDDKIMSKYPPCIKKLASLPTKGNYGRFLLATFLLNVHKERDAKYALLYMLSEEEKQHILDGNCKDQWRAITSKDYPPPSCKKMIECEYCDADCKRQRPVDLEIMEEENGTI